MARFKFLHAADIHLDSPLRGLSRYEGVPAEDVRLATRTALRNLVDAAIEEQVAFVVIAGDLYDGDWPDFSTGLAFCAFMGRLGKAGIDVYLLYGNHDAESNLTKKLPLPDNVHVFSTRKVQTFIHEATGTSLHGWSYRERDTRNNLAQSYPAPVAGRFNIGVLHTALSGRPPHAPYAPCTAQELAAKGYDYWALGHVHDFEIVSHAPFIVFPGNIQGRNIRETGPKGAVIVTVEDNHIVGTPELIVLDAVRWARIDIDAAGIETESDFHRSLAQKLACIHDEQADNRPLMLRLIISGASPLHGTLAAKRQLLREEARAIAVGVSDSLWLEKVELKTIAHKDLQHLPQSDGDELAGLLAEGMSDPEFITAFDAEITDFLAKIPPDLGAESEMLAELRQGDSRRLRRDAASALSAHMAGGAD